MADDEDIIVRVTRGLVDHLRTNGADMGEAEITDDQGQPTGLVLVCLDPELSAELRSTLRKWQEGLAARGELERRDEPTPE